MQCIQCNWIAYKQASRNHFVSYCVTLRIRRGLDKILCGSNLTTAFGVYYCVRILGFDPSRADNSEAGHAPSLNQLTVMGPLLYAGCDEPPLSPSSEEPLPPSPSTEPQIPLPPSIQSQPSAEKIPPSGQQAFDVEDI